MTTLDEHHNQALRANRRVLLRGAGRITLGTWPLLVFIFLAKLFVNLLRDQPFEFTRDVVFALFPALGFAGLLFILLFLVFLVGTKIKMKQLQANPGPGKPARPPRSASGPPEEEAEET